MRIHHRPIASTPGLRTDFVAIARGLAFALGLAACEHPSIVTPAARGLGPSESASKTTTVTLGTYSIPIDQTNTVNDALRPNTNTGIFVPAGTYYRIRVKGSVVVSTNPAHLEHFGPGASTYSANGTYGPSGRSSYNELRVNIMRRNVAGGATTYLPFLNPITGTNAPDSARTDVFFAEQAIEIQAGRFGISGVQRDNQNNFTAGFYALSAPAQVITVESVTDVAHLAANPNYIRAHQLVVFTASRDDGQGPGVQSWHWQVDAGAAGNSNNPCWWNNPCQLNIDGSGTMTVYTNVGPATAHVTVYSVFTLQADKPIAYYGDTVTFTPLYNFVAGPAARWRWVPADTSDHSTGCANFVAPCKKKIVGSGTMWAYTATSGGGDSASAQVTVRDKFELRAAPSLIRAGAVVTFRPLLNGQPAAAARWRWIPEGAAASWDNVAGCTNGATECHRATFVSGVMWAFRSSTGGDSASALVTVSPDCGSALARAPSRLLAGRTRMIGPPTERGAATPRSFTTMATGCSDSTRTAPDAGTGSLPTVTLHVVVETPGIDAVPSAGNSVWPLGTVVPFQFLPKAGYDDPVVFVDDTLKRSNGILASSGTIVMSAEHSIRSATDTNFALRPGVASLRLRLRALINAGDKPLAFARYLIWALDTAANVHIDDDIAIAEYLEFNPLADSSSLAHFDDALSNYGFQINVSGAGQHTISILSPTDTTTVIANGVPGGSPRRATTTSTTSTTGVAFIYVNGVRTVEKGALASKLALLGLLDPVSFPNSLVTYYWNHNLRGEITGYADQTFGCAGLSMRDAIFREGLVALVRYADCKLIPVVTIPIITDLYESAYEFAKLQGNFAWPITADADRLAKRISDYHQKSFHTVMVTHSQGNMVYNEATGRIPSYDGVPVNATKCTAAMALAAPMKQESFGVGGVFLDGMTIPGDILLLIGLPNDFPQYRSQASLDAQAAIGAEWLASDKTKTAFKWGPRIHDLIPNYFEGVLAPITRSRIRSLYDYCLSR